MAVVNINVLEDAGFDRQAGPVTLGVPFPRGTLEDADRAILTYKGNTVQCQREVTSRWSDGSVRWLLVDFLADVNAKYIQCAFSTSYSGGVRMIRAIDYAYRICGYEELKVMSLEVYDAWFTGFAAGSGFSGRRMAEPLREAPYFLHLIK